MKYRLQYHTCKKKKVFHRPEFDEVFDSLDEALSHMIIGKMGYINWDRKRNKYIIHKDGNVFKMTKDYYKKLAKPIRTLQ